MIKRSIVQLALAFVSLTAFAASRSLYEIVNQPTRPTMAEVEPILSQIEEAGITPIDATWAAQAGFDKRANPEHWIKMLLENGPQLIAAFEHTYPGARWVFLGRDGLPWADLFEAYYSSIGQKNRVIRLGISKPSFQDVSDQTLVRLMESQGIEMDTLDSSYPVVFVDSVSQGFGRQGRRLMGALYNQWMKKGRDPLLLLNKVDMIGLQVSTFQGFPNPYLIKPLHQFLQALYLLSLPQSAYDGEKLAQNLRILTFPEQVNHMNEAGYTHFMGTWHDSFGPIIYDRREGKWLATPGEIMREELRNTVLWVQAQIWEFVKSGRCDRAVKQAARELGYEFPKKRPPNRNASAAQVEKFREEILSLGYTSRQLNPLNATHVLHWLTSGIVGIDTRANFIDLFNQQSYLVTPELFKEEGEPKTALRSIRKLMTALQSKTCAEIMEGQ